MMPNIDSLVHSYGQELSKIALPLEITPSEQNGIVYNLIVNSIRNSFFIDSGPSLELPLDFEGITTHLSQNGLTKQQIKELLLKSPQILLYCQRPDDIYLLFKGDEYQSYVLVNGNDYRCYSKALFDYSKMIAQDLKGDADYTGLVDKIIATDEPYHLQIILDSANREDFQREYGLSSEDTVKDILEKMKNGYSKKNFYVKSIRQEITK